MDVLRIAIPLQKVYEPFFRRWAERCWQRRVLQQGQALVYLADILLVVILALAWTSLRTGWGTS